MRRIKNHQFISITIIILEHFYFSSEFGKTELPSKSRLSILSKNGDTVLLVLDSCVCLDIVNHCCPIKITKKEAIKMASQFKS
jgi:hypothetical protein